MTCRKSSSRSLAARAKLTIGRPAATDSASRRADAASAQLLDDGTIEIGFRGDDAATARLLRDAVAAGIPIVTFARAASDLEELFLQVTAQDPTAAEAVA